MTYLPSRIASSVDLARWLNSSTPLTDDDVRETPLDWQRIAFLGSDGIVEHQIDLDASSEDRCVLREVNGAVDYKTEFHFDCPMFSTMPDIQKPHWCPAVYEQETYFGDEGTVTLDWREVGLDHGSHSETDTFDRLDQARAHFAEQCAWMAEHEQQVRDEETDEVESGQH